MKSLLKFSFLFLALGLMAISCKNKASGDAAKTGEAVETPAKKSSSAQGYAINTTKSKVHWVGSKPTGSHNGTINISEGKLAVADGQLVSGKFVLDMNSIANTDIEDPADRADLEAHLKGTVAEKADHFFNVAKFPTGSFNITKVEPLSGSETASHNVTGNLTLKGITKSITFPASIAVMGDKVNVVTPSFKINRTDWGVNFMSKSVFDNLKDQFINDEIALNIELETI